MIVSELIKILLSLKQDAVVWRDDENGEGAVPLTQIKEVNSYDVALDGDEVNEEWIAVDDISMERMVELLLNGYTLCDDGATLAANIVLLK